MTSFNTASFRHGVVDKKRLPTMAKVLAPDSPHGRVFGRAPARQPGFPRGRHVQAATRHGQRHRGESPKSADDLPPLCGDRWRGHELADADGRQGRAQDSKEEK
jgi:hypothetical protein